MRHRFFASPARSLSVAAALVTQALQVNTEVHSARAALLQARALRDVRAAGLLPNVSASASAQRGRSGGKEASNSFSVGFDASWERARVPLTTTRTTWCWSRSRPCNAASPATPASRPT